MRRSIVLSLVVGTLVLPGAGLSARRAEEAAIRQTVQSYFDGRRNGDSISLRKAFHGEARMLFVRDSGLAVVPIGENIRRVAENKPKAGAVGGRWVIVNKSYSRVPSPAGASK